MDRYGICLLLSLISEKLFLASATSNLSDVGSVDRGIILENIDVYGYMLNDYLCRLTGIRQDITGIILLCIAVVGMIGDGFKDNLHLTLLLVGSLIVLIILPYTDGLRYLFNVLPVIMMFIGYGFRRLWGWGKKRIRLSPRAAAVAGDVAVIIILLMPVVNRFQQSAFNLDHRGWMINGDVYCTMSKDMYHYIQQSVPENSTIAFWKPRALYLNTNRMAIRPGKNGRSINDADFYLKYLIPHTEIDEEVRQAAETQMTALYENDFFRIYRVDK